MYRDCGQETAEQSVTSNMDTREFRSDDIRARCVSISDRSSSMAVDVKAAPYFAKIS
jgi:hypothetical protein